ncbi:MAG: urea ABC transporter substrate-binding protein [Gemmataceae bacterium]|nr:urea ABC transporter substrate-binding protein [Gemmataceae bacterium]
MNSTPSPSRPFLRLGLILTAVLALAILPFSLTGCNRGGPAGKTNVTPTGDTVKVGILHSLSGTMAISETSLKDAELMAIEEINDAGGVLGKKIVPIVEDPASDFTGKFPELAKKLLLKDKVACVFGCWTSVSRKNVLSAFEDNNGLLFYPVQYEGNESSKNVVYSGAAPNQQILPAVEWLINEKKYKTFYLLGTDYVFPRTANLIIVKYLESKGLKVLKEDYTKFGHQDYATIVQDIKAKAPDVIFSTINGDSNTNFYNELAAQGMTADKFPVVAVSVGEDELRSLDPSKVKGHLAAWNYYQSVDTPKNKEFVKKFQAKYGKDRVTDDPIAAAYAQVYLWKLAVEKAKSFDVDEVRKAFVTGGIEFDAPEGKIKVDPKSLHVYKYFRMGKIRDDRQFDIVFETKTWIEPEPYPQIAFPGWSVDWTKGGITKGKAIQVLPTN